MAYPQLYCLACNKVVDKPLFKTNVKKIMKYNII